MKVTEGDCGTALVGAGRANGISCNQLNRGLTSNLAALNAWAFASPTLLNRCLQVVHSNMASSGTLSGIRTENPHFVQCVTENLSAMIVNPF
jgi:hypothetical protein